MEGEEEAEPPEEAEAHGAVEGVAEPGPHRPVPQNPVGGGEAREVEEEEAHAPSPKGPLRPAQGHPKPHQAEDVEEAEEGQRPGQRLRGEEGGEESLLHGAHRSGETRRVEGNPSRHRVMARAG